MKITGKVTGHCLFGNYELEYTASATADYTYDPGCYRTSNGDGWPPSEDYDDLEFEVEEVIAYDMDGNQVETTEEMWDVCEKDTENLSEGDVDWDWDDLEPDYEPEPEEPWEEWDDE